MPVEQYSSGTATIFKKKVAVLHQFSLTKLGKPRFKALTYSSGTATIFKKKWLPYISWSYISCSPTPVEHTKAA